MEHSNHEELTLFDPEPVVPASREVRLEEGVAEGFAERVALTIYSGGTTELLDGIAAIELTIEGKRANAARTLARMVQDKLVGEGYIVCSDVDHILEVFLEDENDGA